MENIIKKIKKGAKHTRLYAPEKAEMRSVLVRHVKLNPVKNEVLLARGIPSPFNINNFRNKKGISILVIGSLLMGGTVSLAAENTVPGDVLFPVKVHVNENVRGAVAVTSKAKAEWEVRLVERRLLEVEKLATAQNVTPVVQQIAEENLAQYTKHVEDRIAKFEEDEDGSDAVETASSLSDTFRAHEQILSRLDTHEKQEESFVVATTSILITVSTTTQVVNHATAVNTESVKDALKTVRTARGDAEKKHKELKEKYSKDNVISSVNIEQNKSVPVKASKARANNGKKVNEDRKEKIRSSVQATSTPSVSEVRIELKEPDGKKREETHAEVPKVNDND